MTWVFVVLIVVLCAVGAFVTAGSLWMTHRILMHMAETDNESLMLRAQAQQPPRAP